jgi:hypothetical protein
MSRDWKTQVITATTGTMHSSRRASFTLSSIMDTKAPMM